MVFRANGETDGDMAKLTVDFRIFSNASKNQQDRKCTYKINTGVLSYRKFSRMAKPFNALWKQF